MAGMMNRLGKWNSMRHKLLLYNMVLFAGVMVVIVMANYGNLKSLEIYRSYSRQYNELSQVYENAKLADSYAKNYLYLGQEHPLKQYQEKQENARKNLENLQEMTQNQNMKWRYEKLGNMLQTYDEVFLLIKNHGHMGNGTYEETYEFFMNIPDNIERTYMEYATLITEEMNRQSETLQEGWNRQIDTTILMVGIMICSAAAFSMMASRSITKPINQMVKNAQRIQNGEYQLEQIKSGDRELKVLSRAMEKMGQEVEANISHVKEKAGLTKQLLEKENDNLKMNELLMETELKVLQGQINPHFLFNTLSMISKMAYLENAPRTSSLMEITSDLLRYSLDKANSTSDLLGEMECVRNYFMIQEKRFGQRVKFELFVEEGIPNVVVPGMIIQPIIENSVIHGIQNMMEDAMVSVVVYQKYDNICIQIEDNGQGMDSDTVEDLMAGRTKESDFRKKGSSIGVNNVKKRLEMFYGTAGIMNIDSSPGCGTVITLMLPISEEGREQDVSIIDCGRRTN